MASQSPAGPERQRQEHRAAEDKCHLNPSCSVGQVGAAIQLDRACGGALHYHTLPAAPPTPFLRKWTRSRLSDEGYNYDYLCLHATCHAAHFLVCEEPGNIPQPQRSLPPRWWPSGGEWRLTRSLGCCRGLWHLEHCVWAILKPALSEIKDLLIRADRGNKLVLIPFCKIHFFTLCLVGFT